MIQLSSLLAAIPHGPVRAAAPAPGAAGSFTLPGAEAAAGILAPDRQILAAPGKVLPELDLEAETEGEEAPDGADVAFAWFALPIPPQPASATPAGMAPRPDAGGLEGAAEEEEKGLVPSLPIAGDSTGTAVEPELDAAPSPEPQPEFAAQPAPIALRVAAPPASIETPATSSASQLATMLFAAGPATPAETRRTLVQDQQLAGGPAAFADIVRPHAIVAAADLQQDALDMRRQEWMGRMVEHIEALRDAGPARETRLSLSPEALGKVEVSIRQDGDRIHVHFATETQTARQLIADAQPRLAELAEARGVKLGQTSIDSGGAGQGSRERQPDLPPQSFAPRAPETPDATTETDDRIA